MNRYLAIAFVVAATSLAQAQVTGAGFSAFHHPGFQTAQHCWIDFGTRDADLSLYVFGWNQPQPLAWLEGYLKKPLKLGSLNFTPGVFVAFAQGVRQTGPAFTLDGSGKNWSLFVTGSLIGEQGARPTLFIPAARLFLGEERRLRFGLEGSYVTQSDWSQLRLGPVAAYQIADNVTLRLAFLKGTRNGRGDELRFTTVFRF
ncbi:MAG: hypothetical protein HZB70_02685 [Candidatus Berkelbacteria bacterium]|nr:MAG: hypothetical protein HZB70_02685 [Candidatus Berkelbacteria bacterium]QQG51787.1 MAG: hypothetical protein HY845_00310 [Candidatus Berkelbacteria bacterium]